jgi:hypothetical protein
VKFVDIYNKVVAGGSGEFAEVIAVLEQTEAEYAVIGGFAMNAYVEPVFTADADIVIALSEVDRFTKALLRRGYTIER